MVRILLYDLGNTLVRESDLTPFPHVRTALTAIGQLVTQVGEPLLSCVTSNFPATLPVPHAQLPSVFQEFLDILHGANLDDLFAPAAKRVTLSAHAGVRKPDAKFFMKAIQRLGVQAGFDECVFITEEPAHIAACRDLGMTCLQFGGHASPPPAGTDFSDWSEAPLLVAGLVAHDNANNLETAVRAHLEGAHGLAVTAMNRLSGDGSVHAEGQVWTPLSNPALGDLSGVLVELPSRAKVRLDSRGGVEAAEVSPPSPEDIAEATQHVLSLASSGQISGRPGQSPMGATHQVEVDAGGRRYLKRKRFSAI
jgi:beta-phosphoglucomutase-like phosphatase (HAD superfamily)